MLGGGALEGNELGPPLALSIPPPGTRRSNSIYNSIAVTHVLSSPKRMKRNVNSRHPVLRLGDVSFPGPVLALLLLASPYIARSHVVRRYVRSPDLHLERGLSIVHSLLYIYQVYDVLNQHDAEPNTSLPLLEYLALVIGGAALKGRHFWTYTTIAVGWLVAKPSSKI